MARALSASGPEPCSRNSTTPPDAGTRITVELILEKLAAGETMEDVLAAHPGLSADAIRAALRFAADALRADVIYPVSGSGC